MKTIYISGKNGFIESNLAKNLCGDYNIIGEDFRLNNLSPLENLKPDIIIHCAAKVGSDYCEENYKQAFEVNVVGTYNISEIARKLGAYFVYLSTIVVYKFNPKAFNMISEFSEVDPYTWYGYTKLMGESCCKLNKQSLILRLGFIYGEPDQDKYSLVSALASGKSVSRVGSYKKDYLYIDDLVDAIHKLIDKNYLGMLNIGSGLSYSANKIGTIFGRKDFIDLEGDYIGSFSITTEKIKNAIDWSPSTNFWNKINNFRSKT